MSDKLPSFAAHTVASSRRITTGITDFTNRRKNETGFICTRRGSSMFPQQGRRGKARDHDSMFSPDGSFAGSSILSNSPVALSEEKKRKIADTLMRMGSKNSPMINLDCGPKATGNVFDSPLSLKSTRSEGRNSSVSKEDSYVTANEKSCLEDSGFDQSFGRFNASRLSINQASLWRNSGGSSLNCSPLIDGNSESRKRSSSTSTLLHTEGSLSRKSRHDRGGYQPASPDTPLLARQKFEIERYATEVQTLKEELQRRDDEISELSQKLENTTLKCKEIENRNLMCMEELQTYQFMNGLQDQRMEELEEQISSARMDRNEALSAKSKKHKAVVRKMQVERSEYESRANTMIQQMTEQMTQLQKMAMTRIEVLEKELMDQRHATDKWQSECIELKTRLAKQQSSSNHQSSTSSSSMIEEFSPQFGPNGTLTSPLVRFKVDKGNRRSSTSYGRNSTCSTRSSVTVKHGSGDHEDEDGMFDPSDRLSSSLSDEDEGDGNETEDAMDREEDEESEENQAVSPARGNSPVPPSMMVRSHPSPSNSVVAAALKKLQRQYKNNEKDQVEKEQNVVDSSENEENNAAEQPSSEVDAWNVYI